jgi:lipopolysaccharide cholinephosphotransferase
MFIIAAVIASCYGIITVLFGLKERATSLVSGYYTLGSYLTAIISILLVAGRSKIFEKKRWLWYFIIVILATGILLTLNRIHWGITILVFLIVGLIQERKLLVLATIGFIIVMFISPRVGQRLKETINFTTNLSGRDVIWKGASMIWYDHPIIGYGPGTFLEVFPITSQLEDVHVGGWHNDYLQVFIESGALGLLSLLWLIVTVYKRVLKFLRLQQADVLDRKLIVALTFGISTIFLSSLTGSAFLDILILMTMTYYLAFLSILMQTNSRDVKMLANDGMRS